MRKDEELEQLRAENRALRAALEHKDTELDQSHKANQDLREGLKQAIIAIESLHERVKALEGLIDSLQERIKTLERQQAKDSHNSSLPPSSDRFVRPLKSLRKKSGKKPGGQKAIEDSICSRWKSPIRCSYIGWNAVSTASTTCVSTQLTCQNDVR